MRRPVPARPCARPPVPRAPCPRCQRARALPPPCAAPRTLAAPRCAPRKRRDSRRSWWWVTHTRTWSRSLLPARRCCLWPPRASQSPETRRGLSGRRCHRAASRESQVARSPRSCATRSDSAPHLPATQRSTHARPLCPMPGPPQPRARPQVTHLPRVLPLAPHPTCAHVEPWLPDRLRMPRTQPCRPHTCASRISTAWPRGP